MSARRAEMTAILGCLTGRGKGRVREIVGPVALPGRPTGLTEASNRFQMIGRSEHVARWLLAWPVTEERTLLLRLPDGDWYELPKARIVEPANEHGLCVVRFGVPIDVLENQGSGGDE